MGLSSTVNDFIKYFGKKKNILNLLVLLILVLGIPLGVNLAKTEQILRSRAGAPDTVTFSGPNVFTKDNKIYTKAPTVDLIFTAPANAANSSRRSSSANGALTKGSNFSFIQTVYADDPYPCLAPDQIQYGQPQGACTNKNGCASNLFPTYDHTDSSTGQNFCTNACDDTVTCDSNTGGGNTGGNSPGGGGSTPATCTEQKTGDCVSKQCDSNLGHMVCIDNWQKADCTTETRPGVDTGDSCPGAGGTPATECTPGSWDRHCKDANTCNFEARQCDDSGRWGGWYDITSCDDADNNFPGQCHTPHTDGCTPGAFDRSCSDANSCTYTYRQCDVNGNWGPTNQESNCDIAKSDPKINSCVPPTPLQNPIVASNGCYVCDGGKLRVDGDQTTCNGAATCPTVSTVNGHDNVCKANPTTQDLRNQSCNPTVSGGTKCFVCADNGNWRYKGNDQNSTCSTSATPCSSTNTSGECTGPSSLNNTSCTSSPVTNLDKCFVCGDNGKWRYKGNNPNAACSSTATACSPTNTSSECKGTSALNGTSCSSVTPHQTKCYICDSGKWRYKANDPNSTCSTGAATCSSSNTSSECTSTAFLDGTSCSVNIPPHNPGPAASNGCYICDSGVLRANGDQYACGNPNNFDAMPAPLCPRTGAVNGSSNICKSQSNVSGSPCEGGSSGPSSGGTDFVQFHFAETRDGLANAPWQTYTAPNVTVPGYTFSDISKGVKTIFAEFKDNQNHVSQVQQSSIIYVGPDVTFTGIDCELDLSGNGVTVDITGSNFGNADGQALLDSSKMDVNSWSDQEVVFHLSTVPESARGKLMKVKITRSDGSIFENSCSLSTSKLNVGAKFFCRTTTSHAQDNVELQLASKRGTAITDVVEKKVSIDASGNIVGLDVSQLQSGKDYRLCLKAPGGLRRCEDFTAKKGTTVVDNFELPLGDIYPISGGQCTGDGKINSADKAELNREWGVGAGKCGDFSKIGRVNAVSWGCMVHYFNQTSDEKPVVTDTGASSGSATICQSDSDCPAGKLCGPNRLNCPFNSPNCSVRFCQPSTSQ